MPSQTCKLLHIYLLFSVKPILMAFHKAIWHLNNPDTQFCAIRKQFPLEASRALHSKFHYFEYVFNIFNSFIAKQWMSFCGEGENGVSRC